MCCCWLVQCGYESARVVVYLDIQLPVRPFGATTQAYGSVVSMALLCQLALKSHHYYSVLEF